MQQWNVRAAPILQVVHGTVVKAPIYAAACRTRPLGGRFCGSAKPFSKHTHRRSLWQPSPCNFYPRECGENRGRTSSMSRSLPLH